MPYWKGAVELRATTRNSDMPASERARFVEGSLDEVLVSGFATADPHRKHGEGGLQIRAPADLRRRDRRAGIDDPVGSHPTRHVFQA